MSDFLYIIRDIWRNPTGPIPWDNIEKVLREHHELDQDGELECDYDD